MRIGIDASNLRVGGGLMHLYQLLEKADPGSHRFNEITVWAGKSTLQGLPARNAWLNLVHAPMLDRPLPFRLYWQRAKLPGLAREACDVLLLPGGGSAGGFCPYVTMSRNLLPFEICEMRRFGFSWTFLRLLLLRLGQTNSFRKAEGVIFLTDYARTVVMNTTKHFNGQWKIIPHGIDKRFFLRPRIQKPLHAYSQNEPFRLLYVSIVDVYKHQWHVAEAVDRVRKDGFPVMLDLVGPAYPPALKRLWHTIRKADPSGTFIHYRGPVPYPELPSHYHQADGFVFASSCENMPNILLEAMAAGLPIACSNRGPMPEILGDAGVYFDPEEPGDIASAIHTLIEDQALRDRCAWSAYQRAQGYSWDRCAKGTFDFIRQVAGDY